MWSMREEGKMTPVYQLREKKLREEEMLSSFGKMNLKCLCDLCIELSGKEWGYVSEAQEIWLEMEIQSNWFRDFFSLKPC